MTTTRKPQLIDLFGPLALTQKVEDLPTGTFGHLYIEDWGFVMGYLGLDRKVHCSYNTNYQYGHYGHVSLEVEVLGLSNTKVGNSFIWMHNPIPVVPFAANLTKG
jgi:hypothetical protein